METFDTISLSGLEATLWSFSAILPALILNVVKTLIFIAIILFVTNKLVKITKASFLKIQSKMIDDKNPSASLIQFASHVCVVLLWFAGIFACITLTPLDSALTKLLAAGSVLAVIIGVAAQEALSSLASGLMILTFRPFQLGDVVRYVDGDISGIVEEISIRHTVIRTWENKRAIIPNSKMNTAVIENADYVESKVCILLDIGITYESNVELAKSVYAKTVASHASYLDCRTDADKSAGNPMVMVRVQELADSAVILRAWLWAKDNATAAAMKSDILQMVKVAYEEAGVDLAYPHLVVVNK